MSDASSVVDRAAQAVENADAQADGTTPPSNEVQAQERIGEHENSKAAKAAAKKVGTKPTAKPAKPAAEKNPPKYDDATKTACKRAQAIRGKANAVAPVTVTRVVALLKKAKTDPDGVVKAFKSQKAAAAFAGGDKEVTMPELVKELSATTTDPYARGRGLVAISLALMGK